MTDRRNRLAYDPGGLLTDRSLARAAATPLELRDFLDEPAASRRRAERFTDDANPENWRRGTIFPREKNTVTGETKWAVPGLLKGVFDSGVQAATLPGRAMRGEVQLTDANGNVSPDAIAESLNFAGWTLPTSSASRVGASVPKASFPQTRGLAEWRPNGRSQAAMKEVEIDPPVLLQRPFSDDYPNGAVADHTGKILRDMEGREITAKFVAGRRFEGQPDTALSYSDIAEVGEKLMGQKYQLVPREQIDGHGIFSVKLGDDGFPDASIRVADDLHANDVRRVLGHETGHLLHIMAQTPSQGLEHELGPLYNSVIKYKKPTGELTRPQDLGYSDEQAPLEYMAEAFNIYQANPNTMKTMAPETAARIRSSVNENPYLRDIIQFNGKMLPYAAPVGMAYQQFAEPDEEEPAPTGRTYGRLYEAGR